MKEKRKKPEAAGFNKAKGVLSPTLIASPTYP